MSRFFHGGGSDSESSSSDEEELYSDREEGEEESSEEESSEEESSEDEEKAEEDDEAKTGANRFFRDVSESEESEDEDRVTVVKSAKDKRLEELDQTVKLIENAEKINDWAVISTGMFLIYSSLMLRCDSDGIFGLLMRYAFFYRVRQVEPPGRQDYDGRENSQGLYQSYRGTRGFYE